MLHGYYLHNTNGNTNANMQDQPSHAPVTFRGQLKVNSGLEVNVCASIELNSGGGVIPRESRVTCFHWQFISCSIYAESII